MCNGDVMNVSVYVLRWLHDKRAEKKYQGMTNTQIGESGVHDEQAKRIEKRTLVRPSHDITTTTRQAGRLKHALATKTAEEKTYVVLPGFATPSS